MVRRSRLPAEPCWRIPMAARPRSIAPPNPRVAGAPSPADRRRCVPGLGLQCPRHLWIAGTFDDPECGRRQRLSPSVQKIRGRQIAAASNQAKSSFGQRIWPSTVSPVRSPVRREFLRVGEFRPVVAGGFPTVLLAGPCGPVVQMQSWCLPPNPGFVLSYCPKED